MNKNKRQRSSRARYQAIRQRKKYKKDRIQRIINRNENKPTFLYLQSIPPTRILAPKELSLIDNSNEFVSYLKAIKNTSKNGHPVLIFISKVEKLTYETIAVLISFLNSKEIKNNQIHGNAPDDINLKKIFTESGFYSFVTCETNFKSSVDNILHEESNFKVKPEIAGRVTDLIEKKLQSNISEDEIEALYNIFIELMSNTHHHADNSKYGHTKWWLFAHCADDEINITFIDLGIGIFKSRVVKEKVKKLGINLKLMSNLVLVDDLLDGKIQSRIDIDNEIRGKGLPQILEYSKMDIFETFYIVTNDILVNLKNRDRQKLTNNFKGTMINLTIKNKF